MITNSLFPAYSGDNITLNVESASPKPTSKTVANDPVAAKKVAREFESLFIGMMLKSMRETVGQDKMTNGGHGEDVYRSMLDQEYARAVTEHGGIGLTAMLERQLNKSELDAARNRGIQSYDTTNKNAKIEVSYENRK